MPRRCELVGRSRELSVLGAALERLARGSGGVALLEGEGGIGKTRLIEELQVRLPDGVRLLLGAGRPFERARPFGALAEVLRATEITQETEGSVGPVFAADARYRVGDALAAAVERIARSSPVALAVDDAHWADPLSLGALALVAQRLRRGPFLLLLAYRPYPRTPALDELLGELLTAGASHVVVPELSAAEVAEFVAGVTGTPPTPELAARLEDAGGNPLYLDELLRALRDEGPGPVFLAPELRDMLRRRLGQLPSDTVEHLELAAVLGPAFTPSDLAPLAGTEPVALLRVLGPAITAGFLEDRDDGLAFRHDVIRQAVYEAMPAPLRAELHCRAARQLAGAGRDPAIVAQHLAIGARPGDDDAVQLLVEAASRLIGAPATAVEFLRAAEALVGDGSPLALEIRSRLLEPLVWSGRPAEAEADARAALLGSPGSSRLRLGLARALLVQGRLQAAIDELAVGTTAPGLDRGDRAELLGDYASGLLLAGDLDATAEAAAEAIRLGTIAGREAAVVAGLCARSAAANFRGDHDDAVQLAQEAIGHAAGRTAASLRHPHFFLGMALLDADRFEDARPVLEAGLAIAEDVGTLWGAPLYNWMLAVYRYDLGDWDDAVAELQGGLQMVDEVGTRIGLVWMYAFLGRIAARRGDITTARQSLARAHEELDVGGPQFGFQWVLALEALLAEIDDRPADAAELLRLAWDVDGELGVVSEHRTLAPTLVRLSAGIGDGATADKVSAAVESGAPAGVPSARGVAQWCAGMARGDPVLLLEAVRSLEASPRSTLLADARVDAADALAAAGRTEEAVAQLELAQAAFERFGAAPSVAAARARLRAVGVRPGQRGPRRRAATGWDALTETERRVVALVVEGCSNGEAARRLSISRRTVETHLSHVFAKVGVASRTELAAAAVRAGVGF